GTGGTAGNGTGGTAGNGTGGTAGNGTGGTAGNGTGGSQLINYTVEMGDPEASKFTFSEVAKPDHGSPQGYLVLGEAASYTYKEHPKALENVSPLTLPVAVMRPGAKERQPLLVVFDSCNMSNDFD